MYIFLVYYLKMNCILNTFITRNFRIIFCLNCIKETFLCNKLMFHDNKNNQKIGNYNTKKVLCRLLVMGP